MTLTPAYAMKLVKDGRASLDAKIKENNVEWWYIRRYDAHMGNVNRIDTVKIILKGKS